MITFPLRTSPGGNNREHHFARHRRVKAERWATHVALVGKTRPTLPCVVLLTRCRPGPGPRLDDDNLAHSLKGVRDQIAEWLGINDRDPRVQWNYAQDKARDWGVSIEFKPMQENA